MEIPKESRANGEELKYDLPLKKSQQLYEEKVRRERGKFFFTKREQQIKKTVYAKGKTTPRGNCGMNNKVFFIIITIALIAALTIGKDILILCFRYICI